MDKILKATHGSDETPLLLGNVSIPCYVLENGQRVFSRNGLQKAIGYSGSSGDWLLNFSKSKAVHPYLEKAGLSGLFDDPIKFRRKGAGGSVSSTYGYDATILIDFCSTIMDAKKAGALSAKQTKYADQAEDIVKAVAKVGIVALVDEATGYQYDREKDALQTILKAYINEELLPWQKKFPDIFYKELFRLNGWDFTVRGIKKRPGVVGLWTNTLIYKQLPKGVNDELRASTPKNSKGKFSARLHQSLTTDVGHPHLSAQINQVLAIFTISDNMKQMWSNFNKMTQRKNGQLELQFEFDDKGHTISDDVPFEEKPPSSFNKKLKQALNFNPKDKE